MSDFISFARAHGVDINPNKFYPSENIRRCGTIDKPKSTNGAFLWDGQRGFVFNWAEEARAQWYEDPAATRWTEAEKSDWMKKRRAAARQAAIRQQETYAKATRTAQELMRASSPGSHSYLTIKGFPLAQGLVLPSYQVWDTDKEMHVMVENVLLIPMRSMSGEVVGCQFIYWDEPNRKYEKKMLTGMRAKGAVFRMGDKSAPETFVVEGYATGLSVIEALRSIGLRASVVVCFSAGNIEHIAPTIGGRTFVFADNDSHKTGQGEKSAKATGLPYCMAETPGWDANDLHVKQGLMAVCNLIMKVRRA